jgi:hypothetical protein
MENFSVIWDGLDRLVIPKCVRIIVLIEDCVIMVLVHVLDSSQENYVINWLVKIIVIIMGIVIKRSVTVMKDMLESIVKREWLSMGL